MTTKEASKNLLAAVVSGNAKEVQALLKAGVSPDSTGWSAQAQLAAREYSDLASSLRKDRPADMGQESHALTAAAHMGNAEICALLLDAGANIDVVDHTDTLAGMTPLMVAAAFGHLAVAKLLIERECNLFLRDGWARTAAAIAATKGHIEIAEAIRSALVKSPGRWSVAEASLNGLYSKVDELIREGTNCDTTDEFGLAPLTFACHYNYDNIVSLLLAAKANPNVGADFDTAQNDFIKRKIAEHMKGVEPPSTKLTYARYVGHVSHQSFLFGDAPLLAACQNKSLSNVKALLSAGADVNIRSRYGSATPLMIAIKAESRDLVQLLLESGADINVRDAAGGAVLDWAKLVKQYAVGDSEIYDIIDLVKAKLGYVEKKLDFKSAWKQFKEVDASDKYKQVIAQLADQCQSKPYPWKKRKGVYRFYPKDWDGLAERFGKGTKYISGSKRDEKSSRKAEVAYSLQEEIRKVGFLLVSHLDEEGAPMQLLFPTTDKYAAIAACGTDGANYGLGTQDIIETLQDIDQEHPFELTDCSHDSVGGKFTTTIADPLALAKTLYQFCSAIVDGEIITGPEDIAKGLAESNRFYLRWD